jgi:hypothetical protein
MNAAFLCGSRSKETWSLDKPRFATWWKDKFFSTNLNFGAKAAFRTLRLHHGIDQCCWTRVNLHVGTQLDFISTMSVLVDFELDPTLFLKIPTLLGVSRYDQHALCVG